MQPAKKVRVMKFFTWISMKSQMGHAWRRRIFMHWHAYVCMRAFWYIEHIIEAIKWDEFLMFHVSRASHSPCFSMLYREHCCKCRIIYYLNISYGCSKSRDTRVWLRPPRIQAATYSTHKRHSGSFNAETRTHIKQIFPFIPRISAGCSVQNSRGTMLSDFFWAAHRSVYKLSFVSYSDSNSFTYSSTHTLDKSSTPMCHVISLKHFTLMAFHFDLYGFWQCVKCLSVIVILGSGFCLVGGVLFAFHAIISKGWDNTSKACIHNDIVKFIVL